MGGGWGRRGRPTFPGWGVHATSSPISPAEAGHMALTSAGLLEVQDTGTAVRTDQGSGLSKVFDAQDNAQVMPSPGDKGLLCDRPGLETRR